PKFATQKRSHCKKVLMDTSISCDRPEGRNIGPDPEFQRILLDHTVQQKPLQEMIFHLQKIGCRPGAVDHALHQKCSEFSCPFVVVFHAHRSIRFLHVQYPSCTHLQPPFDAKLLNEVMCMQGDAVPGHTPQMAETRHEDAFVPIGK